MSASPPTSDASPRGSELTLRANSKLMHCSKSLKYLIGTGEQRWWHGEAKSFAVTAYGRPPILYADELRPTHVVCCHKLLRNDRNSLDRTNTGQEEVGLCVRSRRLP